MTTFLLIRHGENDLVGRAIAGWTPGVELNETGRRQAAALAERLAGLPIAALYSSPLERTRQTAAPLAERLGLEVRVSPMLGEVQFGDWTGLRMEALDTLSRWRDYNTFRSGVRIPGGEMAIEVQARVVAELDRIRARHPDGVVAVFSHGDPIRVALAHFAGIPLDFCLRLEIYPASLSILQVWEGGTRLLRINDTGDLPALG